MSWPDSGEVFTNIAEFLAEDLEHCDRRNILVILIKAQIICRK